MSLNVLIVDDSSIVRSVVAKTLRMADLPLGDVHQAANGREGLDVLESEWVDVVFADINMPVMTGVEMIEQIRANDKLAKLPVVVVSTEGSQTRIEHLKSLGITAYLRKPFQPEQFREIINTILELHHAA